MGRTHIWIVASGKLKRSRRMGGRPENMFDLRRFRERVKKRRACRGQSSACGFACSSQSGVPAFLSCPLRSPRAISDRFSSLGTVRERPSIAVRGRGSSGHSASKIGNASRAQTAA
ncbi:hypothetical protein M2281_002528 [Mesorhizobium soli]|nr:hypothetical protein [Mesorhizobium soli]MDH6231930.1 hypothetical protein [Mesorhizobium soli]